jgi:hypothetical protein
MGRTKADNIISSAEEIFLADLSARASDDADNVALLSDISGGTPGGSDTQLQYNNAGAFGGITGATTDGTAVTLTAPVVATSLTGSYLTASEMLITNGSKGVVSAPVATYPSLTELTYVKGVTSAIQTQINTKAPTASPTFTGTVTIPTPFTLGAVSVTPTGTELNFVDGVTSNIQTQLDAKQPLDSDLTTIAGLTATTDNFIVSVSSAWASRTPTQVKTTLSLDNVDNTSDSTKNSATVTLTNKRITKRTGTTASSATPTINTDNVDFYSITALATAITSFTTNLSGTPTEGQTLWIAITDNGTARAITWGASFEASGTVALPTTTVMNVRLDCGFVWNVSSSKWRIVAVS